MKKSFSPKELAQAIGFSESSVRRWIDSGLLPMTKTAGGHRRVSLADAARFIRQSRIDIVRPELLGLTDLARRSDQPSASELENRLFDDLQLPNSRLARDQIVSLFLSGQSLVEIFDGPLAGAMHRLGELWTHSPAGILLEHHAVDTVVTSLNLIRTMLPQPPPDAPFALGAAPAGDVYVLPALMATIILAEAGFHDMNHGPNTPLALLADAAATHKAKIAWVSLTSPIDPKAMTRQLQELAEQLSKVSCVLVVGGRRALEMNLANVPNCRSLSNMSQLSAYAMGLITPQS